MWGVHDGANDVINEPMHAEAGSYVQAANFHHTRQRIHLPLSLMNPHTHRIHSLSSSGIYHGCVVLCPRIGITPNIFRGKIERVGIPMRGVIAEGVLEAGLGQEGNRLR